MGINIKDLVSDVWDYTMDHQWANTLAHSVGAGLWGLVVTLLLWAYTNVFMFDVAFTPVIPMGMTISAFCYVWNELQDIFTDWLNEFDLVWSEYFWDAIGPIALAFLVGQIV